MSMDVGGAKGGVKSEINVTPLVDVMLVLLIIMMLIAPMLQQGVALTLPQAQNTVEKPDSQDQAVIAIGANKQIYLNTKQVSEAELATKVNEAFEGKAQKVVYIKADADVDYGTVMGVMDQLRHAAIEDVGLIVDKPKSAGGGAGGQ